MGNNTMNTRFSKPFNGLFDKWTPEKYYELARRIALRDRMKGLRVKMYPKITNAPLAAGRCQRHTD